MSPSGSNRYTPKQIEKYRRQKYIAQLEKIGKNLFRMLRDEETTARQFQRKFTELLERLDTLDPIRLDTEYHRASEAHFRKLFDEILRDDLSQEAFDAMREGELSRLNRLQKMRNRSSYKKEKHRSRTAEEGWV